MVKLGSCVAKPNIIKSAKQEGKKEKIKHVIIKFTELNSFKVYYYRQFKIIYS